MALPHPDVLREIARLGGVIDDDFEPGEWRADTPVGERRVPDAVQAALSVVWPEGQVLVAPDEGRNEVTFPQLVSGDPISPERPAMIIAYEEVSQYWWVIDLDDPRPDDPMVYDVDHAYDPAEDPFASPKRLSEMLAQLDVYEPPAEARFMRACAHGDLAVVTEELRGGASLGPDESGLTPLHLAAASRSPEVVEALLEAGAGPNVAITTDGMIGIEYLTIATHTGISVEVGQTPLHIAVNPIGPRMTSQPPVVAEVVRLLLAAGADPSATDDSDRTALTSAAQSSQHEPPCPGQIEALGMLLAAGCDPNHEDSIGYTPLTHAINQPQLTEPLLDAGADPARPAGWTTLHHAAREWELSVASLKLMLAKVPHPDIRSAGGITPLHCAAEFGDLLEVVQALVEAGADVHAQLDDPSALESEVRGRTPLELAREAGNDEVAAYLEGIIAGR